MKYKKTESQQCYKKKMSEYFLPTLKESPHQAEIESHKLMLRAGMIRKLASGIYEFLPLGWRVVRKIENIIREEMDSIGGQEIKMSAIQPKSLWDSSKRWEVYGDELIKFKDRSGRDFCLGPTHEEVVTYLVKENVKSYKELPLLLYQFQMKFRDEIRPRFGVMRAREFYMKDAYSFDATWDDCKKSYKDNFEAYKRIFTKCGLDFVVVEAQTGNIGGHYSHEFMVIADTGEEEIVICKCGYGSNIAISDYKRKESKVSSSGSGHYVALKKTTRDCRFLAEQIAGGELSIEEVHTPDVKTVEEVGKFLNEPPEKFIKTLIYNTDKKPVAALVRGDSALNENLLKAAAGVDILNLADEKTIKDLTGGPLGFSGPVGLKGIKIYADTDVTFIKNGISGANKKNFHIKNINYTSDYEADWVGNLREVTPGDCCVKCGAKLKFKRGIEVGHTFLLGTKYSKSFGATFVDKKGKNSDFIMGCYGIGVSRIVAAAIEQNHDSSGIIWNRQISPFGIIIIQILDEVEEFCASLYERLGRNYEVLWDDRTVSTGVKFKSALLIGIPVQIVVGKSYVTDGKLEVQYRSTMEKKFVEPEKLEEIINE